MTSACEQTTRHTRIFRSGARITAALLFTLSLAGCSGLDISQLNQVAGGMNHQEASAGKDAQVLPVGTTADFARALSLLEEVEIKGRAPRSGYSRDQFGSGWLTVSGTGCDARNVVLARDLTAVKFKSSRARCVVLSDTFKDPYTGTLIDFIRGQDTSSDVQIDHVVALSDAWQKGAQQWSTERRREFANDPLNLLASDGPTNAAKGDSDAATWLPPNKGFHCAYVARQTEVKAKYDAWMSKAEHRMVRDILRKCI